jgi:hypothetical protein
MLSTVGASHHHRTVAKTVGLPVVNLKIKVFLFKLQLGNLQKRFYGNSSWGRSSSRNVTKTGDLHVVNLNIKVQLFNQELGNLQIRRYRYRYGTVRYR